jgi:AcrR family transcriptional regulator
VTTVSEADAEATRPYRMQARAKSAAETKERILEAAEKTFDSGSIDEFTLTAIADRAGVSVQTVLRHFGNRDGMLAATLLHIGLKMRSYRDAAPAGDTVAAVASLIDYFDRFGDRILRLIAERERHPSLRLMTDFGWAYHEEWCERVFESDLAGLSGVDRKRRMAQLTALTDVHVWKRLRHNHGLSRRQTQRAIREVLQPLIDPDA